MSFLPELGAMGFGAAALRKVLGPAAGEVGEAVRRWTEYRLRNVGRVIENAAEKVADDEGEVPMRVAMRVLEDASYSDDDVIVEYLGGVLASSHTLVGRDDRGVTWSALVATLSSYQVRTHYLIYREFRRHLVGRGINLGSGSETHDLMIFVPMDEYVEAMQFTEQEAQSEHDEVPDLLGHILFGLSRAKLIGSHEWAAGAPEDLKQAKHLNRPGIVLAPSALGAELFMWAHGFGQLHINALLDPDLPLSELDLPSIPSSGLAAELVEQLRAEQQEGDEEAGSGAQ